MKLETPKLRELIERHGDLDTCLTLEMELILKQELQRIHALHFSRHRLVFIDAMGNTYIHVTHPGKDRYLDPAYVTKQDHPRLQRIAKPLDDVLGWYCRFCDEHNLNADGITLEPLRTQ